MTHSFKWMPILAFVMGAPYGRSGLGIRFISPKEKIFCLAEQVWGMGRNGLQFSPFATYLHFFRPYGLFEEL
jgi:hypothetical protein